MELQELNVFFEKAVRENWESQAFSDYQGKDHTYEQLAEKIAGLHKVFGELNIGKRDKIALLGGNSSDWAITYLAVVTYGSIVVPILPDFSTANIHHIVNHSDAKLLFVTDSIYQRIESDNMRALLGIINLNDHSIIRDNTKKLQEIFENDNELLTGPEEFSLKRFSLDDICLLSYTSGTTGFTKGVMLSRRSISSNITYAQENMPLQPGNRIVSFLPMAHVYGMLFEFLFPFTLGCHITFLTKIPSPQIVTRAFGEIRPHLILSVPLVVEKIYKKRIQPSIEKPVMKFLLRTPLISSLIKNKINKKLENSFGEEFKELVIGGAPLSEEVDAFFRDIGFRFTIGYGMTECAPLISYASWTISRFRSAGKVVDRMQIRISKKNEKDETGEIQVKGDHVMSGYYKNVEDSKAAFTEDGWLKTGDLGYLDEDGFLYIKGRSKNMLLGPSGQNIYPEELEARICNLPYIQECVVKQVDQKLIALIYPEMDLLRQEKVDEDQLKKIMKDNRTRLNHDLPRFEHISEFIITDEEFRKTPKRNIKRYLYA